MECSNEGASCQQNAGSLLRVAHADAATYRFLANEHEELGKLDTAKIFVAEAIDAMLLAVKLETDERKKSQVVTDLQQVLFVYVFFLSSVTFTG